MRRGDGTYVISTIYMENDVLGFGNVEDRYRLALDLFDARLMIGTGDCNLGVQKSNGYDEMDRIDE